MKLFSCILDKSWIKKALQRHGSPTDINDFKSLYAAVKNEKLASVVIFARTKGDLDRLERLANKKGARIIHKSLLKKEETDFKFPMIDQQYKIILAIFDSSVYTIKYGLLQRLGHKNSRLEKIIAPSYVYNPLFDDEVFVRIITNLGEKGVGDIDFWRSWKSYGVYQLLRLALRLNGDCAEFGCYRGYSAAFLAETMEVLNIKDKKILLFDTWEGMPSSDKRVDNYYKKGDFHDTSLDAIKKALKPWV